MTQWSYREYRPQGPIAKYIDCIWMEAFCESHRSMVQHIVQNNSIELIFSVSKTERVLPSETLPIRLKSQLVGLKKSPQKVVVTASPSVDVRFKAQGLYPV